MLDKKNIKILYAELICYTNNLSENSILKESFIANLPCILLDIIDLYNYSKIEWKKKDWHLDRLVKGLGSNYLNKNIKLVVKQIILFNKKPKFYNPLFKNFVTVNKLFIDPNPNNNIDHYENKPNNLYISSVSNIFYGRIKNLRHKNKVDELVDLLIYKIFSLDFLKNFEDKKIRQSIFREKLKKSIVASIKRSNQCRKFLPSNNDKSEIYLGTLYSPFNRIIAIEGRKRGLKIKSADHGPGTAFTSFPLCSNIELDLVSEFITFSELYKTILLKNLNPRLRSNNKNQPIIKVKKNNVNFKPRNFSQFTDFLYLPSVVSKIAHIPPLLDPITYFQLQLNILSSLNSIKTFQLFIREHPETELNIPQVLLDDLNIKKIDNKFEDLKQKFIYIIDHIPCTCLRYAIENNIPMILILTDKNRINKNVFNELCASPNFRYMIPTKKENSFSIDSDYFLSLIEEIKNNYSYNYQNNIF